MTNRVFSRRCLLVPSPKIESKTTTCMVVGHAAAHKAAAATKVGAYVVQTDEDEYFAFDASLPYFKPAKRGKK